jgi:hypothetical protein
VILIPIRSLPEEEGIRRMTVDEKGPDREAKKVIVIDTQKVLQQRRMSSTE